MDVANLRQFIAQNDDFGFEMRVGSIIEKSRATDLWHGATYTDPKTELPRQFDFRFKIFSNDRHRCVSFAAECKNLNLESPVIVCGRKRVLKEAYHDIVGSNGINSTTYRVKNGFPYREDGFVGKSVLRPESFSTNSKATAKARSSDAEIYGKWAQAIASAHDLLLEATLTTPWRFTAVVPIVILPNNTLWTANYDPEGNLAADPISVKQCTFYVGHPSLTAVKVTPKNDAVTLSHIHFLTIDGFSDFLNTFDPRAIDWDHWVPDHIVEGCDRR